MPGPYSLDQRSAIAQKIDALLNTTAGQVDGALIDLMLDWTLALAQQLAAIEAKLATLIAADTPAKGP